MPFLRKIIIYPFLICLILPPFTVAQDYRYAPEAKGELISNMYYCVDYSTEHKQPNWVYYMLTQTHISGKTPRSTSFKNCTQGDAVSARSKDYTKSGYDRGHLCPAADMRLSKEAMSETFLMWNISPQEPSFNRGCWSDLESLVRSYIKSEADTLFIVTGPVFTENKGIIGDNVTVPGLFYKVIYHPEKGGIGFLLPNQKTDAPLPAWQVSISFIEEVSGIDFFPQLPRQYQTEMESQVTWWD